MTQRWIRSPEVVWRTSLERIVLLPPGAHDPTVVTGPGAVVWLLTEEPMTTEEIVSQLARVYRTPRQQIEDDVHRLLDDLEKRGAVCEVRA